MVGICRPAELDPGVAAVGPAQLLETLQECSVTGLRFPVVRSQAHYDADAPHALALLRTRRERPRSRAAEQRDELAPSHVGHGLPPFPLCAGVTGVEDHTIIMSGYDFWKYTCHCRCIRVLLLSQSGGNARTMPVLLVCAVYTRDLEPWIPALKSARLRLLGTVAADPER